MADKNGVSGGEKLLTKYLIFESKDGGTTLSFLGVQLADNSDQAKRLFLGVGPVEGLFVAISENACRLIPTAIKPKTTFGAPLAWDGVAVATAPETSPELEDARELVEPTLAV